MRSKIIYEWCLEIIENENIVDNQFEDKLIDISKEDLLGNDLVLCRAEGNEKDGIIGSLWAYVKDRRLPDYFTGAGGDSTNYQVPLRFHKELEKYFS